MCEHMKEQKDFVIEEVSTDEVLDGEYSGQITKLDIPKRRDRSFVTNALLLTVCAMLMFAFAWGTMTGDWTPLEKGSHFIEIVLGYMLGYYYS